MTEFHHYSLPELHQTTLATEFSPGVRHSMKTPCCMHSHNMGRSKSPRLQTTAKFSYPRSSWSCHSLPAWFMDLPLPKSSLQHVVLSLCHSCFDIFRGHITRCCFTFRGCSWHRISTSSGLTQIRPGRVDEWIEAMTIKTENEIISHSNTHCLL